MSRFSAILTLLVLFAVLTPANTRADEATPEAQIIQDAVGLGHQIGDFITRMFHVADDWLMQTTGINFSFIAQKIADATVWFLNVLIDLVHQGTGLIHS